MIYKLLMLSCLMMIPTLTIACEPGYVKTDVEGVCMEQTVVANPSWVSDEKPPTDKMPSYQREGVIVVSAQELSYEDAKADREKAEADHQGKRTAGLEK